MIKQLFPLALIASVMAQDMYTDVTQGTVFEYRVSYQGIQEHEFQEGDVIFKDSIVAYKQAYYSSVDSFGVHVIERTTTKGRIDTVFLSQDDHKNPVDCAFGSSACDPGVARVAYKTSGGFYRLAFSYGRWESIIVKTSLYRFDGNGVSRNANHTPSPTIDLWADQELGYTVQSIHGIGLISAEYTYNKQADSLYMPHGQTFEGSFNPGFSDFYLSQIRRDGKVLFNGDSLRLSSTIPAMARLEGLHRIYDAQGRLLASGVPKEQLAHTLGRLAKGSYVVVTDHQGLATARRLVLE